MPPVALGDDERDYRRHFLRQDARTFAVLIGIAIVMHLLFIRADHLFQRGTDIFVWLLALRFGLIGFSAWTMTIVLRADDPDQFDRWSFCWAMACALANTLIIFSRPGLYTGHVVIDLFAIIAFYAVQPGPTCFTTGLPSSSSTICSP